MGVDQLVTGGDFDDPVVDSLTSDSVNTDQMSISDLSAELEKTSDQSISANTDTTINWDQQSVDSDLYSYDSNNNQFTVLSDGDYSLRGTVQFTQVSDQDVVQIKILINGSGEKKAKLFISGTSGVCVVSHQLKDVSKNDTIRLDARAESSGTITGFQQTTNIVVTKEG